MLPRAPRETLTEQLHRFWLPGTFSAKNMFAPPRASVLAASVSEAMHSVRRQEVFPPMQRMQSPAYTPARGPSRNFEDVIVGCKTTAIMPARDFGVLVYIG